MERQHRHGKRRYESRPKDSRDHYERERHQKHANESNHPTQKLSKGKVVHTLTRDALQGLELSAGDNYVRRWLAETREEQSGASATLQQEASNPDTRGLKVHRKPSHHHENNNPETTRARKRRKSRKSSSDSSILEEPSKRTYLPMPEKYPKAYARPITLKNHTPKQRKQSKAPSIQTDSRGVDGHLSLPKETFEKRARHKTREDRYKPRSKDTKADQPVFNRRATTKRLKTAGKNHTSKPGEELMRNFASRSIGQERITLRPSYGLGLFNNGRMSNSAKADGLPDLAFAEMEFLQHHNRHISTLNADQMTKSPELDASKASKAQEDISAFFKHQRNPLHEINFGKRGQESSAYYTSKQSPPKGHTKKRPSEIYQPLSSNKASVYGQSISPRIIAESVGKFSEKATTYLSWSETQISPRMSIKSRRINAPNQQSLTSMPESIQSSLERTGIYRDGSVDVRHVVPRQGCSSFPQTRRNLTDASSIRNDQHNDELGFDIKSDTHTRAACPHSSSSPGIPSIPQKLLIENPGLTRQNRTPAAGNEAQEFLGKNFRETPSGTQDKTNGTGRGVRVENFNTELGWQQKSNHTPRKKVTSKPFKAAVSEESKNTPLARDQIAKLVRIKRPSTTLPVIQNTVLRYPLSYDQAEASLTSRQKAGQIKGGIHESEQLGELTCNNFQLGPWVQTAPDHLCLPCNPGVQNLVNDHPLPSENPSQNDANVLKNRGDPEISESISARPPEVFAREINSASTPLGLPLRGGWAHPKDLVAHLSSYSAGGSLYMQQTQNIGLEQRSRPSTSSIHIKPLASMTALPSSRTFEKIPNKSAPFPHIGSPQSMTRFPPLRLPVKEVCNSEMFNHPGDNTCLGEDADGIQMYGMSYDNGLPGKYDPQSGQLNNQHIDHDLYDTHMEESQYPSMEHDTYDEMTDQAPGDWYNYQEPAKVQMADHFPAESFVEQRNYEDSQIIDGFWKPRPQY